jgi:hypothetical protein
LNTNPPLLPKPSQSMPPVASNCMSLCPSRTF